MQMALVLAQVEPGMFINPWKLLPVVILLLVWGRLATWIDKDSEVAHLPRIGVNLGVLAVGGLGFVLFFLLPSFLLSMIVLVLFTLGSVGGYIGLRASKVGTADLAEQLKAAFASKGSKEKKVKEVAAEVQLLDAKGRFIAAPDEENPDYAGYVAVQKIFAEPMRKKPERLQLVPAGPDGYKLTYVIDGFPYAGDSTDKATASAAIEFIKKNAGLDLSEKRKPQRGKLRASAEGQKRDLDVTTSGSSAGEALDVQIDVKSRHAFKLETLGMGEIQEAAIRDSIAIRGGLVILSAPKGQGLTSLCYGVIRAHDAYQTNIHTIERAPDQDLEGITQTKLAANAPPQEESKQVAWVVSQEPDVMMLTSIEDPASARELIKQAAAGRKSYVAVRANDSIEAINAWRKLVGDDKQALKYLMMVVSSRVVRKLCPQCKVGITPDPESLRKMNLDPNEVSQLFQERTEPMVDPKGNPIMCDVCMEVRFKGRTGVYEVVIIDEEIRSAVLSGANSKQIMTLVRKQRMPLLQEAALDLITQGETSVKEVKRVFTAAASPPAASGQPAQPAAR